MYSLISSKVIVNILSNMAQRKKKKKKSSRSPSIGSKADRAEFSKGFTQPGQFVDPKVSKKIKKFLIGGR